MVKGIKYIVLKEKGCYYLNPIENVIQLLDDQKVEQALSELESIQQSASEDELFTIAAVYTQWGFLQEAEKLLSELHEKFPSETEVSVMLAEVYIELEKDEQALQLLEDIPSSDAMYPQVLLQLADVYQAQGLFEVAELKLLEAKKIAPEEIILDFALAEFYFSIGSYKQSIPYYESILIKEKEIAQVSIYERLAEAQASIGEYENAFQMYEHVESSDVDFLFKQGFAAYKSKRLEVAITIWEKIIDLDPHYAVVYYYIAKTYQELHMLPEAEEFVLQGLQYDEYNKELHYQTAVISNELQKLEQRNKHIQTAVELDHEYTEAVLFYLNLLNEEEDYEEIIAFTEQLEKENIVEPLYVLERARALIELEVYERANQDYEQIYIHFKNDPPFLKEYSMFLIEEGEIQRALEILEVYITLEPLDEEALEMLSRLKDDETDDFN